MDVLRDMMHRLTVGYRHCKVTVVLQIKDSGLLHWYMTDIPIDSVCFCS